MALRIDEAIPADQRPSMRASECPDTTFETEEWSAIVILFRVSETDSKQMEKASLFYRTESGPVRMIIAGTLGRMQPRYQQ